MSELLDKLRYYYALGGLTMITQVAMARAKGQSRAKELMYYYNSRASEADYPKLTKLWYKWRKGVELNLDEPTTFNEKIQWMKLYDHSEIKSLLSDKYLVRDWVAGKIGEEYLIPLLGVWDSFDQIDFSRLPDRFALKANHGSAWNYIVTDKSKLDMDEAKSKFDQWMSLNYSYVSCFELQYSAIRPRIIAEQYLDPKDGTLFDYKFHCFNGEPKIVEVIGERVQRTHSGREAIMRPDWTRHPGKSLITMEEFEEDPPKPQNYDQMLRIARTLSSDFSYVRVDLYNIDGDIKFGEMTFSPDSGMDPIDEHFPYADLIRLK